MGLRDKLGRLERAAEGEMIVIRQRGGTVKKFPATELEGAYLSALDLALGREGEEHPMLDAFRNASDPKWREMYSDLLTAERTAVEDLSET